MVRSLCLLIIFLGFIGGGFVAPFVATLGYVWVDTFSPQSVAYIVLNQLPDALDHGLLRPGKLFCHRPKRAASSTLTTTLVICLGIWSTVTLLWAEVPDAAWSNGTGPSRPSCSRHSSLL